MQPLCLFLVALMFPVEMHYCILINFFLRYHLGDYGGEILNEVKLNRPEKEMSTTASTLHNGNHHKVPECKIKVIFLLLQVSCYLYPAGVSIRKLSSRLLCLPCLIFSFFLTYVLKELAIIHQTAALWWPSFFFSQFCPFRCKVM